MVSIVEIGITLPKSIEEAGRQFVDGLTRPFRRYRHRRVALAAFHPRFPYVNSEFIDLVSYSNWHETNRDWNDGNGILRSATYGELPHIWTRPDRFAQYEAQLVRFVRSGGQVRRMFVLGHEIHADANRFALYRTLRRHEALGFNTRIRSVIDLRSAADRVGVKCDTLASFNGRIAYFIQCHLEGDPTLVRYRDARVAIRVENVLSTLWTDAATTAEFFNRHQWEIPTHVVTDIARDIETVQELAGQCVLSGVTQTTLVRPEADAIKHWS